MAQSEPDVILFLVGNKKDKEDEREVTHDRVEKFKRDRNILFSIETSAKTREKIENLFILESKILYHNNKDNYYWKSHSILESINELQDPDKQKLTEKVRKIRDLYENLSELYQSSKISNSIPLN